jgi:hypothetical protein
MSMKEIAQYVDHAYTYGGGVKWTIENEQKFTVPVPPDVETDKLNVTVKRIWEKRVDKYVKRNVKLDVNCEKLYFLIMPQCAEYTKAKPEGIKDYKAMNNDFDVITLIKAIKGLTYQFEVQNYHSHALHQAKTRFYMFSRPKTYPTQNYLRTFKFCSQ